MVDQDLADERRNRGDRTRDEVKPVPWCAYILQSQWMANGGTCGLGCGTFFGGDASARGCHDRGANGTPPSLAIFGYRSALAQKQPNWLRPGGSRSKVAPGIRIACFSTADVAIFIGRKNTQAIMVLDSRKFPRAEDKGMTISIGVLNHHVTNGVCSFAIHRMLQAYAQLL
jgi:hypothetical protein